MTGVALAGTGSVPVITAQSQSLLDLVAFLPALDHLFSAWQPMVLASLGSVLLVGLLWLVLGTAEVKGALGEWSVRLRLALFLDWQYYRFHNVIVPSRDRTTQIDHVLVSPFGVFAIETKTMTGEIYGKALQKRWTQKFYKRTRAFLNPLRQNYGHTKALEENLGIDHELIHSVVVFAGSAKIRTDLPDNVIHGKRSLSRHIKSFRKQVFSAREVHELCAQLTSVRLPSSWKTRRAHRAHVHDVRARYRKGR